MDSRLHRWLVRSAVLLTLLWIGWTLYQLGLGNGTPEARALAAASRYIEDGQYIEALQVYQGILENNPENSQALYGGALSLMQLGAAQRVTSTPPAAPDYLAESLSGFDLLIGQEQGNGIDDSNRSLLAVSYANRGIVNDWLGDHQSALSDYRTAMRLEPEVAQGPGLLTRFLRNQAEAPPTIADRADYLTKQLALPASERLLQKPEIDSQQRSYRM
jgi:tetratricopeptide (TPR) repeat protein